MSQSRILLAASLVALASCGREAQLRPAPGHAMPVKPLMAKTTPSVKELLTPPPYARPDRVDELVKRSQPRQIDEFDLPPPNGGSAPPQPAGTTPEPPDNEVAPATPGE
ncbi:MAG: hypothetical protein V4502_05505 [Pseudomonadota bacterium]